MEFPAAKAIIAHFEAARSRDNGALSDCFLTPTRTPVARWYLHHRRDNHRLGGAHLLVLGKNPSSAKILATRVQGGDATAGIIRERLEDGTLDKVFGRRVGWVTLANLLPVISKTPRVLTQRDKSKFTRTNLTVMKHLLEVSDAVWVAWGQTWGMPWAQQSIPGVVNLLKEHTDKPMKALWAEARSHGESQDVWYPHHPQRITITPEAFNDVRIVGDGVERPL